MSYHVPALPLVTPRTLAVGGILALHVLLVYLLATGLIQHILPPVPPSIKVTLAPDAVRSTPPPPLSRTVLENPKIPQEENIPQLYPPDSAALTAIPPVADTPPTGGGTAEPQKVPLRILGKNLLPDSESYYPPDKIRLGISGASYVRVCVDSRGVRQGDPALEQTSGDSGLDAAALNVARHGQYAHALQGDQPVPTCFRFRIVFRPVEGR
ncbi:MAG: energy transducer TonB [Proteobacteria bacterium]|nr:energy transducer TonB [Pseudomonadota bacterium]